MLEKPAVLDIIAATISDLNQERAPDQQLTFSPDLMLFGVGSQLDSLEVVNVVVMIEEKVADVSGVRLGLTASVFNGGEQSPLKSASALAAFVCEQLAPA